MDARIAFVGSRNSRRIPRALLGKRQVGVVSVQSHGPAQYCRRLPLPLRLCRLPFLAQSRGIASFGQKRLRLLLQARARPGPVKVMSCCEVDKVLINVTTLAIKHPVFLEIRFALVFTFIFNSWPVKVQKA